MNETISSDSDFELIQYDGDLKNENEIKNKNVLIKPENPNVENEDDSNRDDSYCEICNKDICNRYFLKIHMAKKHGINFYANGMEKSTDKKFGKLAEGLEQINNLNKQLCFVQVSNKWKEFAKNCCETKCINTENPVGTCIKGYGFANLIDDENIDYVHAKNDHRYDKPTYIYAENSFNKPKECTPNYSLFYFEIKYKIKEENKHRCISVGLNNSKNIYVNLIIYLNRCLSINFNVQEQDEGDGYHSPENILWNKNNIFGCGLVYPPSNTKHFSYIFFTHNGEPIGNPILLNENCDGYKPFIRLQSCSGETNFGKDLKANPFVYDFSKHKIHKYSDFEKDLNELIEMFPLITKEGVKQLLLGKGGWGSS